MISAHAGGVASVSVSVPNPSQLHVRPVTHSLISIAGSDRLTATSRDREERVRRIREQQEDERRKKLEELKEHVSLEKKERVGKKWNGCHP